MAGLVIDTHTLVWYLTSSPRLSPKALARIEATMAAGDPVYVPAISLIEVIYLVEKGRLSRTCQTGLLPPPPRCLGSPL